MREKIVLYLVICLGLSGCDQTSTSGNQLTPKPAVQNIEIADEELTEDSQGGQNNEFSIQAATGKIIAVSKVRPAITAKETLKNGPSDQGAVVEPVKIVPPSKLPKPIRFILKFDRKKISTFPQPTGATDTDNKLGFGDFMKIRNTHGTVIPVYAEKNARYKIQTLTGYIRWVDKYT